MKEMVLKLLHALVGHDWKLARDDEMSGELVFRCACGAERILERADIVRPPNLPSYQDWKKAQPRKGLNVTGGPGGGVRG